MEEGGWGRVANQNRMLGVGWGGGGALKLKQYAKLSKIFFFCLFPFFLSILFFNFCFNWYFIFLFFKFYLHFYKIFLFVYFFIFSFYFFNVNLIIFFYFGAETRTVCETAKKSSFLYFNFIF